MPLSNEHIPLPCSLRETVLQRFPQSGGENHHATLSREQVVRLLGRLEDNSASPLMSLRRCAEREGQTGDLKPLHASAIEWITLAFEFWEDHYPLEQKLALEVHKLLPLTIALALSDDEFFTPGAHPLHQLLDCLQHTAVGWQERLDRAGQMLEQRIVRAVVRALEWFDDRSVDFAHITRELTAAAERDAARAQRMVQRLAEAEAASLKTAQVKRDAADVINAGLEKYSLPLAIGEFLKGAWFDSAQLVALKFGSDSHEWRQFQRVTEHLMESVQSRQAGDESNQDRLVQITKRLPQELRDWLLSLQHDPEAANDAIGLVEYAHLRLRHGQNLSLTRIPPITLSDTTPAEATDSDNGLELQNGQWFLIHDNSGDVRAQLTLQLQDGRHLLFTNVVGLKALDLYRDEFLSRLHNGRARLLPTEDSFSLALAGTAGIDSDEKLRDLINPGSRASHREQISDRPSDAGLEGAQMPLAASASPADEPSYVPASEAAWKDAQSEPGDWRNDSTGTATAVPPEFDLDSLELTLADEEEPEPPMQTQVQRAPSPPNATAQNRTDFSGHGRRDTAPNHNARAASPAPTGPRQQGTGRGDRPSTSAQEPDIDVPMGAWLGFHDGETPIMAKLAVYDPRRDNYIFVNRRGIALRELSRSDLLALIDEGLVDILETRSYFRDEVQRARGQRND